MSRTVMIAALALTALCVPPAFADGIEAGGAPDLVDTSWQLVALNGDPTDPAVQSTLEIRADGVGGNGGCNTFGGDLTTTETGIDIANVFSTMMACDGLAQEQAFFAALEAATGYAIVDGNLRLTGPGDAVLAEFAPAN